MIVEWELDFDSYVKGGIWFGKLLFYKPRLEQMELFDDRDNRK